jgi:hypothetical protein
VPTLSKYVEQMQIRTRNKKKVLAGPATDSVVYHILERMVFSTGNPYSTLFFLDAALVGNLELPHSVWIKKKRRRKERSLLN